MMESSFVQYTPGLVPPVVNLGSVERIPPGEGREFEVNGELIAVFRPRKGTLFALQAQCPHKAGHLADGFTGGGIVVCPLHAFKFELASGAPVGNDCPALRTFPVSVSEDGEVLLALSSNQVGQKLLCQI